MSDAFVGDQMEEWKDVPDYEGSYQVSNYGRVVSLCRVILRKNNAKQTFRERLLKLTRTPSGYLYCTPCIDGDCCKLLVHQLVMLAFVGPCPEGMEVCHNDGNPQNNRLDNLRYDTHKGNMADTLPHGTHNRGERCGGAKLKEVDIQDIKMRRANGEKASDIAHEFGIGRGHVWRICNAKTWRHLTNKVLSKIHR